MTGFRVLISRCLGLLRGTRKDAQLTDEIQVHLDLLADEHVARGMSPEEARFAARRAFGGVDQIAMRYREQRGLPLVDALAQDVRFAFRILTRDRGFAATAIFVLALGIGVSNMFFTLTYAFKWRGLPIDRPERVLYLSTFDDRANDRPVSLLDLEDIRAAQRSFEGLAAYVNGVVTVGDEGRAPDRYDGAYVSANAFALVGVAPIVGRAPVADEDSPGAAPVALIGANVWKQRYDGVADIVGRSILINGSPATVIGVMPDRSGLPSIASVWLPLGQLPGLSQQTRDARTLRVIGRLRDGVPESEARAEVEAIVGRLETAFPETNRNVRSRLVPINRRLLGDLTGWTPFILAGLIVVAIACANVANLLLACSLSRAPEIAIRASLGAGRSRLIRQLLIEASVLSAAGGLAGLGLSIAGVTLFKSAIPDYILPYWIDYTLDARIFAALAAVSFATVFICGLVPAIHASKIDVNLVLKTGGRTGHSRRGGRAWTMTFLTAELALALVLLAQLGVQLVVAREELPTDVALRGVPIIASTFTLPVEKYPTPDQRLAFFQEFGDRLRARPEVEATTFASVLPADFTSQRRLEIGGRPTPPGATPPSVSVIEIGPDYFDTLRLSLTRGRAFAEADGLPGQTNAIVNERFVDVFLDGQDPLGQTVAVTPVTAAGSAQVQWQTVIGVSPSIRQNTGPDPLPVVYLPVRVAAPATVSVLVRSSLEPGAVSALLRREAQAVDSHVPLYRMQSLAKAMEDAQWNSRVSARLAGSVTLLSIALATVGLYAVTAHGVALRTWELGLRMALGARSIQIVSLVVRGVRIPLFLGFLIGTLGALAWDRAFASGRGGVMTGDPKAIALITAMMTAVVLVACFVPVRRATRTDAVNALRHD